MNCTHCQSTNPPRLIHAFPIKLECTECGGDVTAEVCANAVLGPDPVRAALEELMFLFPRPGDFGEVNDRVIAAHAAARNALTNTQP